MTVNKSRVGVIGSLVAFFAAVIVVITTCAVYFNSPRIYEAKSEFTVDLRCRQGGNGTGAASSDRDSYGSAYEEIFNTRQSDWRSEGIFTKVIQQYRANYPNSQVPDKDLVEMLASSELELVRHSRLITIAVRSKSPEHAAALANAYAEAIESFTDEENKKRQRLETLRCDKVDNLQAELAILNQSLQTATADVNEYEKRVAAGSEWVKALQTVQKNPETFGKLLKDVPRSSEIAAAYTKLQTVKTELATLKTQYTREHPAVVAKKVVLDVISKEFDENVKRALTTAQGDLTANKNQLDWFKWKCESLNKRIEDIGQKTVRADAGLKQLEQGTNVSREIYQALLQKENEQRIAAEQNYEIIRVGRPAQIPTEPILPNPKVIFGLGAVLLLVIVVSYVACNPFFKGGS